MVEVKRKPNESSAAMIRRFTRRVQQSGILLHTRRRRFHKPELSKREVKLKALRREKRTKERMRLEKLGKTPEKR